MSFYYKQGDIVFNKRMNIVGIVETSFLDFDEHGLYIGVFVNSTFPNTNVLEFREDDPEWVNQSVIIKTVKDSMIDVVKNIIKV